MEFEFHNNNLSVSFEDGIECDKLSSTARKLIGIKYVKEHLRKNMVYHERQYTW